MSPLRVPLPSSTTELFGRVRLKKTLTGPFVTFAKQVAVTPLPSSAGEILMLLMVRAGTETASTVKLTSSLSWNEASASLHWSVSSAA